MNHNWKERLVTPEKALAKIEPGMNLFLGTGAGEPRTLIKRLMESSEPNLTDLTLIQIVSLGDAISINALRSNKYRLKTFFSGWVASEAITTGRVDLIPSRFSAIPTLINEHQISVDAALIQITEPDEDGLCSLGIAVDVARQVMAQADLVIGEINPSVPRTFGDTFVSIDEFDFVVESQDPMFYFPRWPVDDVFDEVAANVASVIEDGACLAFSAGPLFEALPKHLASKRHLGLHTPFVTDAVMKLIKSGAVTNRRKSNFRGKTLTSYALGTPELMKWLDKNPMVEFQGVAQVFHPLEIGRNRQFVSIIPVRKVDLTSRIAMHMGKGNVTSGPGQTMDFLNGAEISRGGFNIFALPSRNLSGEANIRISIEAFSNQINFPDSVDMVATEYGIASLGGRTVRERAQALIEIAHPDDRAILVEQAKKENLLYPDQIFLHESSRLYPNDIAETHTFKNNVMVRFRAIKPSDEEGMRRLFYRFSDEAIYYRYFTPIKTMPHAKMQAYVNVDYRNVLSIVGLVGTPGQGKIISEARFVRHRDRPLVDVAFIVDEQYQGLGIATHLYRMLARLARQRGAKGMTADVLSSNLSMLKVFEKGDYPVQSRFEEGAHALFIPFEPDSMA
ncbi:MAG: GNAT family N-acetyltransferase [Desulfobacteraceae bacterium]|nr:GNAT family N-acetyltransferase [Desulfobacteraceae bacterium]